MLAKIIASFLDISELAAEALLKILTKEQRWQSKEKWTDITIDPGAIYTRGEFFKFLQCVGQNHWFKGFDRSKLPDNASEKPVLLEYFNLFKQFGLIDEIYQESSKANVVVILGSSWQQIKIRLETLVMDLRNGIIPSSKLIIGAASNRKLTETTDGKEAIEYLEQKGYKQEQINEMNLLSELTKDKLTELKKENPLFAELEFMTAYSYSQVNDRTQGCITTKENGEATRKFFENDSRFVNYKSKLEIMIYSTQPYGRRQNCDFGQYFKGGNYAVNVRAKCITENEFIDNVRSIAICLKEIASFFNFHYNSKNLNLYDKITLTDDEQAELKRLCSQKTEPQSNNSLASAETNPIVTMQNNL
jgi:hypothetical protein